MLQAPLSSCQAGEAATVVVMSEFSNRPPRIPRARGCFGHVVTSLTRDPRDSAIGWQRLQRGPDG
jgi:hypothetical protein